MITIKKIIKNNRGFGYCLILFMITTLSCNEQNIGEMISGSDYKLWQKVDNEERLRGTTTYYYFDSKGKFGYYKKYLRSNRIEKLDIGDVVIIETWKFFGEKKLTISEKSYNIRQLNDTVLVYGVDDSPTLKDIKLIYNGDRLD